MFSCLHLTQHNFVEQTSVAMTSSSSINHVPSTSYKANNSSNSKPAITDYELSISLSSKDNTKTSDLNYKDSLQSLKVSYSIGPSPSPSSSSSPSSSPSPSPTIPPHQYDRDKSKHKYDKKESSKPSKAINISFSKDSDGNPVIHISPNSDSDTAKKASKADMEKLIKDLQNENSELGKQLAKLTEAKTGKRSVPIKISLSNDGSSSSSNSSSTRNSKPKSFGSLQEALDAILNGGDDLTDAEADEILDKLLNSPLAHRPIGGGNRLPVRYSNGQPIQISLGNSRPSKSGSSGGGSSSDGSSKDYSPSMSRGGYPITINIGTDKDAGSSDDSSDAGNTHHYRPRRHRHYDAAPSPSSGGSYEHKDKPASNSISMSVDSEYHPRHGHHHASSPSPSSSYAPSPSPSSGYTPSPSPSSGYSPSPSPSSGYSPSPSPSSGYSPSPSPSSGYTPSPSPSSGYSPSPSPSSGYTPSPSPSSGYSPSPSPSSGYTPSPSPSSGYSPSPSPSSGYTPSPSPSTAPAPGPTYITQNIINNNFITNTNINTATGGSTINQNAGVSLSNKDVNGNQPAPKPGLSGPAGSIAVNPTHVAVANANVATDGSKINQETTTQVDSKAAATPGSGIALNPTSVGVVQANVADKGSTINQKTDVDVNTAAIAGASPSGAQPGAAAGTPPAMPALAANPTAVGVANANIAQQGSTINQMNQVGVNTTAQA
jgi:hypothetical protein